MAFLVVFQAVFLLHGVQFGLANSDFIDMSHTYDADKMVYWANMTEFKHTKVFKGKLNDDVPFFSVFDITTAEHAGTHLDAPSHLYAGVWSVEQIPVDRLVGQAIVVNISAKASKDRNAVLTVSDLQKWEKTNGRIPDGAVLFLHSGWGKFWPNTEKYMGTSAADPALYSYPGFGKEACEWIVKNRKIKGVGVDTISIDIASATTFPCHQTLFSNNIYALENVANIDQLPVKGATVIIMPMKVKDGSGAPARILATTSRLTCTSGVQSTLGSTAFVVITWPAIMVALFSL